MTQFANMWGFVVDFIYVYFNIYDTLLALLLLVCTLPHPSQNRKRPWDYLHSH